MTKTVRTKILQFLLICALFFVAISIGVGMNRLSASAATETGDLSFMLINDGTEYKVSASNKSLTSAIIPDKYNNLPVTEIADNGFMMCRSLEQIFVPPSIKRIGNNAFMNDTNLKKVLGMSGVTSYGNNAFAMCSSLDYLILPAKLTQLGTNVVKGIESTIYARASETEMTALNSSWNYDGNVVYGNTIAINKYTAPDGTQGYEVAPLQMLEPSDEPLVLYSWCYYDIDDSEGGPLLNIAEYAFLGFEVPSITVKHPDNSNLNHSITIKPYAFTYTNTDSISLSTTITFEGGEGFECGEGVFLSSSVESINLKDSLDIIPTYMFSECNNLKYINYTEAQTTNYLAGVKKINKEAFSKCVNIEKLEIPNTIEYIGENAFNGWGTGKEFQYVTIDASESIIENKKWDSQWDNGVNFENCEIEFIGETDFTVTLVLEQEGVINPIGDNNLTVKRNDRLCDMEFISPTSMSHNFTGKWYTSPDRSQSSEYNLEAPIKSDLTLYAGWEIKTYSVYFPQNKYCYFKSIQNHEIITGQTIKLDYGTTFLFYLEINEGYEGIKIFVNGTLLQPYSGLSYSIDYITEDINISVDGKLTKYQIHYSNLRGGENPNAHIEFYTVEDDIIEFEAPYWKAYKNANWNITSIDPKVSRNNVTITAIWSDPVPFTIHYYLNDNYATNPEDNPTTFTVEDNIRLIAPSSLGYGIGKWDISGWNKDEYDEDVYVNAEWSDPITVMVNLDFNGGEGNITYIYATYGENLSSIDIPTRYDYKFLGFYSLSNGKQYYSSNMEGAVWDSPYEDTLKASWVKEYIYVTFTIENNNGTALPAPQRFKSGTQWDPITMPTRKGYTLSGFYYRYEGLSNWQIYKQDGTPNTGNQKYNDLRFGTEDVTLVGRWTQSEYYYFVVQYTKNIEWDIISTFDLPYDGSYILTADETYSDYVFDHWGVGIGRSTLVDTYSTERTIDFNVVEILNYLDNQYVPQGDSIYFTAFYVVKQCIAYGSLITLADGSQKAVQELRGDELLLVWNLNTGTFDVAPILFIDRDSENKYKIINLEFSDGTKVKVIYEHAFWDFDLNQYVFLREDAGKYIGHWFNKQISDESGLSWTKVQLISVTITEEVTTAWSPVTYSHLCYYVNGMLSMPGATEGLINIFEVNGDLMKYDEAAMLSDIEQYGLFTYEEFAEIYPIPEEMFNAFNGQYLKVSIGKGLITLEEIGNLINRYADFLS